MVLVATKASSTDIKSGLPVRRATPAMSPVQEPTPPQLARQEKQVKQENEPDRGRIRSRFDEKDADGDEHDETANGYGDGRHANSSNSDDGPTRKRRRSRKGLDKKFECPEKDCGRSYSRAEHLYRHQLNHNPKQVYRCDWGDCGRTFVRLDLCNRHKDRHTAKGSALSRKDSLMSHGSPTAESHPRYLPTDSNSPEVNRPGTGYKPFNNAAGHVPYSPPNGSVSAYTPVANPSSTAVYASGGHTDGAHYPHGSYPGGTGYMHHENGYHQDAAERALAPQHPPPSGSALHPQQPAMQTSVTSYGVLSPVSVQTGYHSHQHNTPQSATGMPYVPAQNFPAFTLPPSDFSSSTAAVPQEPRPTYAPAASARYSQQAQQGPDQQQGGGDMMLLDQMSMPTTIPVFGPSDSLLNKSPYVGMPEDFMAYLFNTGNGQPVDGSGSPMHGIAMGYSSGEFGPNQYSVPYYGTEPAQMGYFPSVGPQQVMSVTNLLDQNFPQCNLSEAKCEDIFQFIENRFHENGNAPMHRKEDRESILEGDRSDDGHMLSQRMMQAYIVSYWMNFSDQIPILHKPTFQPDKTPNLLLIAMMTIGAACLDKAHGFKVTKAGAKLSNFLAWHLRWEMFQSADCRPPAKLWVFQTLILLELYEKMYSTRELHERAHIHHATTITLMRRGRALVGKPAMDSPPNLRDTEKPTGSRHSSTSGAGHTAEEWWNHWITNESTRRAAFAAFVIDSIHCTMFGHSTVMVTHEMRLPLPCDEKLWNATTAAEVGRIEANLTSAGNRPVPFLEALKQTLSNNSVQTNSFGRTILMAGLLSVSWHMNQRDLQVLSLGIGKREAALGGRDRWRHTLRQAFDFWKHDFDKALSLAGPYTYDGASTNEANVVFESRIVLHHLAHMAMHVDIVDCQIFARAKRLLGRAISHADLNSAQRRMKVGWAPSARGRDATYYALKFLASVLCPETGATGSPQSAYSHSDELPYCAKDDVLLNRPWVLYFAALVVWSYGYALEGPCPATPVPTTQREMTQQTRQYLNRYGSVSSPEELKDMQKGINQNTALIMMLKETFADTRWELLQEGSNLLENCVQLNRAAV